jgi:hypothetical protein
MSFYKKSLSLWLSLYVFVSLFSLYSQAQPVSVVVKSEWGSGSFHDAVELDGYFYFMQRNSHEIEVYGSLASDRSARLGAISVDDNVYRLFKFNGLLVVADGSSLKLYKVDGLAEPELVYGISTGQSPTSQGMPFAVSGNNLAYMNRENKVFVLQVDADEYSIFNIYSLTLGNDSYQEMSALGFYGGNIYAGVATQTYEDNTWTYLFSVAKLSLENEFDVSMEFEEDVTDNRIRQLHYLKNGAFIASQGNSSEAQVYGIGEVGYELIAEIGEGVYSNGLFSHYDNTLWLLDFSTLLRYDTTDLSNITLIEQTLLSSYSSQTNVYDKLIKTTHHLICLEDSAVLAIELEDDKYLNDSDFFYLGGRAYKVALSDNKLYIPISNRIDVVDVSSISEPSLISQNRVSDIYSMSHLYKIEEGLLSIPSNDLVHFQLDDEDAPTYNFSVGTDHSLYNSVVTDDRLYVFNRNRQVVRFDILDENSLYELPYESEIMPELLDYTYDEVATEDYLVVTGYDSESGYKLQLLGDITNNITFLTSVDLDYYPEGIAAFGDYVYAADSSQKLNVFKINDGNLTLDSFIEVDYGVSRLDIFEQLLLVYNQSSGIMVVSVYDLSDPATPVFLSSTDITATNYISRHSEVTYESPNLFITGNSLEGKTLILQFNRAPILAANDFELEEDTPLTIELSDLDPEQDEVQVEVLIAPATGNLSFNSEMQTLVYQPAENFYGEDTASIKLLDSHGNFTESTVNFSVLAVNDAPSFSLTSIEATEGLTTEVESIASDIESDTLTFEVIENPSEGVVTISEEGVLTFTSLSDFSGETAVTIATTDGLSEPVQQSITITVIDVNDVPSIAESEVSINEDEPQTTTLTINDPEGHDTSLELVSFGDGIFSAEIVEGKLNLVPVTHFNGETEVVVKVTDELGLSAEYTIEVAVLAVNDLPLFTISNTTVAEDTPLTISEIATDVDGDTLTLALTQAPNDGVFEILADNSVTYTPSLHFNGAVEVGLSVSDGIAEAVTQTLIIDVMAVNDIPTVATVSFELAEDIASELVLDIADAENEDVTLTIIEFSDGIANAEVTEEGNVSVEPFANYFGQATIKISLMDENQASQDYTLTFNILAVDDIPEVVEVNADTTQGTNYSGALPTQDLDGETLTYSMVTAAVNGTVTLESDGTYVYLPNSSYAGSDTFTYSVSDDSGNSVEGKINFTVRARPIATPTNNGGSGGGGSIFYLTFCLLLILLWRANIKSYMR